MNETSDWDHKIISKAFIENVNKKNICLLYTVHVTEQTNTEGSDRWSLDS